MTCRSMNRAERREDYRDTDPDTVPQCLCALALPKFLAELVTLRKKFPVKRNLMIKADAPDAFRDAQVDPDEAHKTLLHSCRVGSD